VVISNGKSACVYRWREVAIAIASSASVKTERVQHLIAATSTPARSRVPGGWELDWLGADCGRVMADS
jgi:hypothetical protein